MVDPRGAVSTKRLLDKKRHQKCEDSIESSKRFSRRSLLQSFRSAAPTAGLDRPSFIVLTVRAPSAVIRNQGESKDVGKARWMPGRRSSFWSFTLSERTNT